MGLEAGRKSKFDPTLELEEPKKISKVNLKVNIDQCLTATLVTF